MATKEVDGLLQVKDAAGDVNVIYPVTKAKNVEGLLDESGKIPSSQLPDMDYLPLSGGTMTGDLILSGGGIEFPDIGRIIRIPLMFSDAIVIDANLQMLSHSISGLPDPTKDSSAANKKYVDSKAPKSTTVDLLSLSWTGTSAPYTQTVTVSGVLADETKQMIQPIPKLSSQAAYMEAGVYASGQAADSLTFTCSTKPTADLTVYVVIQEVA